MCITNKSETTLWNWVTIVLLWYTGKTLRFHALFESTRLLSNVSVLLSNAGKAAMSTTKKRTDSMMPPESYLTSTIVVCVSLVVSVASCCLSVYLYKKQLTYKAANTVVTMSSCWPPYKDGRSSLGSLEPGCRSFNSSDLDNIITKVSSRKTLLIVILCSC